MIKKFFTLLTGLFLFGQVQSGFCATELDYMEYSTDALAQAAYVTDAGYSETVNRQQTTASGFGALGDVGDIEYREAQSFQLSATLTVTAVELRATSNNGATGNWTFRIETDNSGEPSGTLADANASIVVTPSTTGPVKGTFATPFSLTGSTIYWLVMQCDNQTTGLRWIIGGDENGNPYSGGSRSQKANAIWTNFPNADLYFKVYVQGDPILQSYSEATIKQQGSYSLKGIALVTDSLNKTLTRTVSPTIDLTEQTQIKFDIYSSRTGSNINIGIRDSVLTTAETTPNITSANTWQTITWDISGVSNADKDAIDRIIITSANADADNTFYTDNMYTEAARRIIFVQ